MPWAIPYLLPVYKWWPIYWPPQEWQVREFPPSWPRQAPKPTPGTAVPWWLAPKSTWPYPLPSEPKVFGAWPSSLVAMPEDLINHPPFGYINLKVPGQQGDTNGFQIPFNNMSIHYRWLSLTQMAVETIVTPFGPKFYLKSADWDRYAEHPRSKAQKEELRLAAKKALRDEINLELQMSVAQLPSDEKVRYRMRRQNTPPRRPPSSDLFS